MKKVRIGVIGVGGMGSSHARQIAEGNITRAELTAVCDVDVERMVQFDKYDGVKKFADSKALIRSGDVDSVLIATPHYGHTTIGVDALSNGLNVLIEKPISVHKADCEKLIAAHKAKKKLVFAAMFNLRTAQLYIKVKKLIDDGELGELTRVNWIITNWFRTEVYYGSGGWRATWAGEGGGVLLNQSPHQLDMLQWLCGMPSEVTGFCDLGKRHNIEVEDEVTAFLRYPNGATGVFITSTGEAPGTNRLEICGQMGKVVVENELITFTRNEVPMSEFSKTADVRFGGPGVWNVDIPCEPQGGRHADVMQNFVDAILDKTPLVAEGREGIHSVELANAMLYSSLIGKTVTMPLDGKKYERALKKLIRESKFVKKTTTKRNKNEDISASFHR